ncbi:unnamed protein product [Eruca vesicaria subsp. sativa]|uniref:Uncharacterized protein n=1 Tax=Eruca vesicaria subsp. sativa TaxID=29727 RepID=A0ABC8JCZ6_ERUVS|nr:unnamed protein product [Eruca vesicaria subsp. sativa]
MLSVHSNEMLQLIDDPTAASPEQPKQLSADLVKAANQELKQAHELFGQAADNCLNMKKPE